MINLNTLFEKNKLNISNKEELLLVELEGLPLENKKELKRKKLNISFCIDISASMSSPLKYEMSRGQQYFSQDIMTDNIQQDFKKSQGFLERKLMKTKLDLVKEAAIKALSVMQNGDYISIVAFDNNIHTIQEAIEITSENRTDIVNAINSLATRGSTNIHGGWLHSVEEVAKNISKESLNRVIMLTDGEANSGKRDVDGVCSDVLGVAEKNVSTSTFGVGESFNEVLLSSMSDSGSGNFYFIAENDNFDTLFNEEFTGLSNICATGVKLEIKLNNDIKSKALTTVKEVDGKIVIQDLTSTSKIPVLLEIDSKDFSLGKLDLGSIIVSFKDVNGNKQTIEKALSIEVVSENEWDKLDENKEVKIQELLVEVANKKMEVKKAFSSGDIVGAKNILRESSNLITDSELADDRLTAQSMSLDTTLLNSEKESSAMLSKSMHYESYRTLKGKDL